MYSYSFAPRPYQESIVSSTRMGNALIVLPTGLGKTNVFVMIAIDRLNQKPDGKVLLLGPTRPLIDQYERVFREVTDIPADQMATLTGRMKSEKRVAAFNDARIIYSTPQGFENDLITGKISLQDVVLIGFDEAHRAVGDYSYVWIAQHYMKHADMPKIVALTASPGSEKIKIDEVIANLHIDTVESRSYDDPDVKPYVQTIKVDYEFVDLPSDMGEIITHLRTSMRTKLSEIAQYLNEPIPKDLSRTEILRMQGKLQGMLVSGNADFAVRKALSRLAEILKIQHALELAESQGVYPLHEYFVDLFDKAKTSTTKATKNLVADTEFRIAYAKTITLRENGAQHPKFTKLLEIAQATVRINPDAKIIIFNTYRDNAAHIVDHLRKEGMSAELFVGQAKKKGSGMKQSEQKGMLERFARSEFSFLVSTSIGEEGLDIPKVDLVIFYEPVPSTIRAIQRRGRTGRSDEGRVIVLVTKGTRDEIYLWSTKRKEKTMNTNLKALNGAITKQNGTTHNVSLKDYSIDVKIIVDSRERSNPLVKELSDRGCTIEMASLESADYVVSNTCGIEFKTAEDFAQSLIDGRLLSQAKLQKQNYTKCLMIIEGYESLYSVRNLHPNALRGAICALALDFGITLIPTKNPKDSADMLLMIAKREQATGTRPYARHFTKDVQTIPDMQEYIISSLPGIGPAIAPALLDRFGTIRSIVNATPDDLSSVEKVGTKKSRLLHELFTAPYRPDP